MNPKAAKKNRESSLVKLHRPEIEFDALRHTFETIGGQSRDQVAVDHIMGHTDQFMASHYQECISDERLRIVVDYVHGWLFEADNKI